MPERIIETHRVNGLNDELYITVHDRQGVSNHHYVIRYDVNGDDVCANIVFQNGPIKEYGVNGISIEALLAIVADRLEGFQSGEFSCRENAIALTKIQEAMLWLLKRTRDRESRGVEGTSAV